MKRWGLTVAALILATPVLAEELVQRQVLNEQPLSGAAGTTVIVSELKLMPGGRIPLHTHPGDEHAVVVVGGLALLPNGKQVEFAAGTPMFFPEGQVHGGVTNLGDAPMEIVTTHIVRTDAPFIVAAE